MSQQSDDDARGHVDSAVSFLGDCESSSSSLHSFRNDTDKTARMVISVAPAGLEKMFLEVGQPVAFGQQAPPPSKTEIDKLLAVAPSYGIEIRLPQH